MRIQIANSLPAFGVGYIVWDGAQGSALLVDAPPGTAKRVTQVMEKECLRVAWLASTHGHWDVIADNVALLAATGAALCAHPWDATRLSEPHLTMEPGITYKVRGSRATRSLHEGDVIEAGTLSFRVLHTPGHTPGSICLYEEKQGVIFTGDTLLSGQVGRTDLPGGNLEALNTSLARLADLPPDTRVFPAHGPSTRIRSELWLLQLAKSA